MGRLIKISEIEEFSDISTVPDAAITDEILQNVRKLNEITEIESFIRKIIHDPNETPHGPTEIADILSSHIHIKCQKKHVAFVLKGKSFKNVKSIDVAHQLFKLRSIPSLDMMVLGATGNIQDDIQNDFVRTALDAQCDYLIIDAQDFARLFIVYGNICPIDGTPFNDVNTCHNGHIKEDGLSLEMEVREQVKTFTVKQRDVSTGGAKRYDARIIIDKHYTKDVIKNIIKDITSKLRQSNYHRNELLEEKWGKSSAHVVWLFIAYDIDDIRNVNWVCRTSWIDPNLNPDYRPVDLNGNDRIDDIDIHWNDDYKVFKSVIEEYQGTKEDTLKAINSIKQEMLQKVNLGIKLFHGYEDNSISNKVFIRKMEKLEPIVQKLYMKANNIPLPPDDCKDYDQACQNLFAIIDNIFLAFSERGKKTWEKSTRDIMIKQNIKYYYENLETLRFEEKKLH